MGPLSLLAGGCCRGNANIRDMDVLGSSGGDWYSGRQILILSIVKKVLPDFPEMRLLPSAGG